MKNIVWALTLVLVACGDDPATGPGQTCDGTWDLQADDGPLPPASLLVLGSAVDFSTSSVDLVSRQEPSCMAPNRLVAGGDSILRRVDDEAVVLTRGAASSIQRVAGSAYPGAQVSLGSCNPHDIAQLSSDEALITCYDDDTLRRLDLSSFEVSTGPSLSTFVDGDGELEMDHVAVVGERVFVTLQRLDRDTWMAGDAVVAVLDRTSLELVDMDGDTAGTQGIELPCQNPFTDLDLGADGRLHVGCSGDFMTPSTSRLVAFDGLTGDSDVILDGEDVGGIISALRLDGAGTPYFLVAHPDAFAVEEMRLVRDTDVVYRSPGYTLAGLDVAADGVVYVGNRSADDTAGLWIVPPGEQAAGPFPTTLPPFELQVF